MADEVSWIPSAVQTKTFSLNSLDHRASIGKFNVAAITGMLYALMKQEDIVIMVWLCESPPLPKDPSIRKIITFSLGQSTEHCHSFIQQTVTKILLDTRV